MISGKNYIGNKLSSSGSTTFNTFNPQLNIENENIFTEATIEELNASVILATKAFKVFRNTPGKQKANFLNTIADEILALDDVLIKMFCSESGLPEERAKGERGRTIVQLRAFADLVQDGSWVEALIDTAQPDRKPISKPDSTKNDGASWSCCCIWSKQFSFSLFNGWWRYRRSSGRWLSGNCKITSYACWYRRAGVCSDHKCG